MAKTQKLNLIEELTTHKCDFQVWPLLSDKTDVDPRPREEPKVKLPPPSAQVDPQSFAPYDPSVYVPFDLYLSPKPIVGKDPRECFNLRKPSKASSRVKVNLPTILSPALPLGDVECEDLDTIIQYTYTGLHKILMEEAALRIPRRRQPPNRVVAETSNVKFYSDIYPPLPPGWIAAAKHWDCLQSRGLGDPFKTFWTRRGPEVECGCCCNPIPEMLSKETRKQISDLARERKLNLSYDVTVTGYGGYRPICAKGVPLEKSLKKPSMTGLK